MNYGAFLTLQLMCNFPLMTGVVMICVAAVSTLYNVRSVHRRMFSTSGGVQYIGGYHEYIGGYHEYIGGCSVHRGDIMMNVGGYHEYIGDVQYIGGMS